ncbi:TauD/TfdA dioxygenase family protein [Streptomyces mayteni]
MTSAPPTLRITRLGGRIGAVVEGVRIDGELAPSIVAEIRAAALAHKVVFFRDQEHLDEERHEAFGRLFGPLFAHPTVPAADGRYAFPVDSEHGDRANRWHTDVTFVPDYPAFSVLRAITIPPYGGNTVWANTATAYAALPEPLRALADGLRAIHTNEFDYAAVRPEADAAQLARFREVFAAIRFRTEHPVVRVHPETGERSLVLGNFVQRFAGIRARDSQLLFELFQGHIERPENTVRWQWRAGDVAMWDNRATQHYAVDDSDGHHRSLRRITVAGEVPVAPDGGESRLLEPATVPGR